jgi:hypothetical protein
VSAIIDASAIHAIFERPLPDGSFAAPAQHYLQAVGAQRPILLLAFAPKAAGTYFRQAAINAVGGQLIRGSHAQGGRDGTPYLPNFLACYLDREAPPAVVHLHMQALTANRHFIEALGLKPVIMLRSLPDLLASFWDMLDADPAARAEGLNCRIPPDFTALSRAQKGAFVIDVIAPWYASYFATWKAFCDDAPGAVCVLRYRGFRDSPADALHKALTHAGFSVSVAGCERALAQVWAERANHRYNKAVPGRGREYFSPSQIEKISRLLSFYGELAPWRDELMGDCRALAEECR